ncbi:probetacellulin [Clinocottus analis]|uniref:probetacellulin n=1 Tax=Clinocottus analis TaxID=304258 RepID=UPI0035C22314
MAQVYRLCVGIVTALAFSKASLAEWDESANRTESLCRHHGDRDNCTADTVDAEQWNGHFSKCPEQLTNYCIHGECRYVDEQQAPSCRCQQGYIGARCEYLDLDWRIGEKRHVIIVCTVAGLALLILIVVFVCFCSHRRCRLLWRRRRRRQEPKNGTEKLHMMDAGATHTTSAAGPSEPAHTIAV